jgi:hypothetical protein
LAMGLPRKVGGCDARACRNIGRIGGDDKMTTVFAGLVLGQMLQDRRQEHACLPGRFYCACNYRRSPVAEK